MSNICRMPWSAITVTTTGEIKPCCVYNGNAGYYNNPSDLLNAFYGEEFNYIRQQMMNGNTPKGCEGCAIKNSNGQASKMTKYSEWLKRENKQVRLTEKPDAPIFIELATSNSCNLTCVTCDSRFSSKWIKLDKEYKNKHSFRQQAYNEARQFSLDETLVDELIEISKNAELGIELIGGEPLYHKTTIKYLSEIAKIKPDLPISITTNLTILTDGILDILSKLNNLTVNVSIDGTDKIYEYIRGFDYQIIKSNLMKLNQIKPRALLINTCISIYNIFNLYDIIAELHNLGKLRFNTIVYQPDYLCVNILPENLKIQTLAQLYTVIKDYKELNNTGLNQLKSFANYLAISSQPNDATVYHNCKEWTLEMNKLRNLDICEIEPKLSFIKEL